MRVRTETEEERGLDPFLASTVESAVVKTISPPLTPNRIWHLEPPALGYKVHCLWVMGLEIRTAAHHAKQDLGTVARLVKSEPRIIPRNQIWYTSTDMNSNPVTCNRAAKITQLRTS